jgi:hypothetical protein
MATPPTCVNAALHSEKTAIPFALPQKIVYSCLHCDLYDYLMDYDWDYD